MTDLLIILLYRRIKKSTEILIGEVFRPPLFPIGTRLKIFSLMKCVSITNGVFMKTQYLISAVLIAVPMILGQANAGEKELKKDQVPKAVIAAFEKAFPRCPGRSSGHGEHDDEHRRKHAWVG